jgi:hypothetical protein
MENDRGKVITVVDRLQDSQSALLIHCLTSPLVFYQYGGKLHSLRRARTYVCSEGTNDGAVHFGGCKCAKLGASGAEKPLRQSRNRHRYAAHASCGAEDLGTDRWWTTEVCGVVDYR